MLNELITQLIIPAGTLILGGVAGLLTKSGRVKAKAEAMKAMAEAYEYRIKTLHETINTCNETIKELQERIASLNHALDDKTDMIRKYVEDIIKAQEEVNRVSMELIEAQKEIADLRVASEYLAEWRCEHPDCNDPRGRRPPNGKLCGNRFRMPAVLERYRDKAEKALQLPPPACE